MSTWDHHKLFFFSSAGQLKGCSDHARTGGPGKVESVLLYCVGLVGFYSKRKTQNGGDGKSRGHGGGQALADT